MSGRVRLSGPRRFTVWLLIMLGLGLFLYPSAADWFARRGHAGEIIRYSRSLDVFDEALRASALAEANAYNADLRPGAVRDPYSDVGASTSGVRNVYGELLTVNDTDAIGRVKFEKVGIDLPIYRGTSGEVLSKGAGHLPSSSLPVGGTSTHAVLTAHSGLPTARLFTDLHAAALGDSFWVEVLGERRWYRVDRIMIVEPDSGVELGVAADRDYVTLLTCTPVGVNSHRLLVRGARTEAQTQVEEDSEVDPGLPWWALSLVAGGAAAGFLLFRPLARCERLTQKTKSALPAARDGAKSAPA